MQKLSLPLSEADQKEWEDWLSHPMTKLLQRACAARRAAIKDAWEAADFSNPNLNLTRAVLFAQAECKALSLLEELDLSSIVQEIDDGEHKWFETSGACGLDPADRAE